MRVAVALEGVGAGVVVRLDVVAVYIAAVAVVAVGVVVAMGVAPLGVATVVLAVFADDAVVGSAAAS